jgi:hypothetical protein
VDARNRHSFPARGRGKAEQIEVALDDVKGLDPIRDEVVKTQR